MDNMEVVGKFRENEGANVSIKVEPSSVVVFDEAHIKQEVKEEPLDYVEPGSPDYTSFHNYIKYEFPGTSQSVYCDICWTYCKDAEALMDHQESRLECKQYKGSSLNVVEDRPGESCKLHVLQISGGSADVERCTDDAIPGGSRSDPTYNLKMFVKPLEINENIKSNSVVKRNICNKVKYISESSFFCDICNHTFARKSTLNKHKMKHTGERPFIYNECNQTFIRKWELNRHKLIHADEKPFVCIVCNRTFTQNSSLNRHKVIHTGEKPFTCDICSLNTHKLKHSVEMPFSCGVCDLPFFRKSSLKSHMLKHTGDRPFSYDMCKSTFTRKSHLNRHMLNIHEKAISM